MSDKPSKEDGSRQRAVARRRQQILEAALWCFLENGYHQTGVRDIAKRAGVSLGNLYNHFPGKHDVLVEIAALERSELAPMIKLLRKPGPAPKVLERFLTSYGKYLASVDNVLLTVEITSEAIRKPDIGALFLGNQEELARALAELIERGIQEAAYRPGVEPTEAARLILEMIEGCAYRSVLGEKPMRKLLVGVKDFTMAALKKH